MKLFLDSANMDEIREAMDSGIVSGVTTNPSIIAKEPKGDFLEHINKIVAIISQYHKSPPLSIEVFSNEKKGMIYQARHFVDTIGYEGLNIKIPTTWENMGAIEFLSRNEIKVNATCIFTQSQAVMAANAGAKYVSLFYNRAKDLGCEPDKTLYNLSGTQSNWEIICGSIRSSEDIMNCFWHGADIVTAGLKHIKALCEHEGTDTAIKQFNEDFANWMGGNNNE